MIYFISDIHLGLGSKEERRKRETLLLSFLERISADCNTLYIVGDLFDYWFEYKTVIPREFFRTITALEHLKNRGANIEYLMGNHDFGHQDFFQNDLGIAVHEGDLVRIHSSKKFYIAHGDGKVYNDRGYLVLRSVLRNRLSKKLFQWIHPDLGIALASNTSTKSRSYTDAKDYGKPDGLADFAEQKINEGFDYVIMGHRHEMAEVVFGDASHSGTYINLGDWLRHNTFAQFNGEVLQLIKIDDFLMRES